MEHEPAAAHRVGWEFIALCTLAFMSTSSRLGMRRPWMVTGLVGGSLGVLMVELPAATRERS